MNSSSTLPMKKGRPLSSGPFTKRAEFESECFERYSRGWSISRIALKFCVTSPTIKRAILDAKNNS